VLRSDDNGDNWYKISGNLPTDFGFPIAVHAHEPNTIFVVNAKDAKEFNFGSHEVYYVNALQIALDTIKRDIPNSAMLGAMATALTT